MSYRVDIPTLSANEVYTLTFEYEGTETIQLIVGDLTLETTDRRVVFTTTSPVNYIESNVNLTNLNMYEGYYESDDFGGEYTQESYLSGKSLINLWTGIDSVKNGTWSTAAQKPNLNYIEPTENNTLKLVVGDGSYIYLGNMSTDSFYNFLKQNNNYTIIVDIFENNSSTESFSTTMCHYEQLVKGESSYSLAGGVTGRFVSVVKATAYTYNSPNQYWGNITGTHGVIGTTIEWRVTILEGDHYDEVLNGNINSFYGIGCVKSPKIVSEPKNYNIVPLATSTGQNGGTLSEDNTTLEIANTTRYATVGIQFYPEKLGYPSGTKFAIEFDYEHVGTGTVANKDAPYLAIGWGTWGDGTSGSKYIEGVGHFKSWFTSTSLLSANRITELNFTSNPNWDAKNKRITITNLRVYKIDDVSEVGTYDCCKITTPDDLELHKVSDTIYDKLDLTTGILYKNTGTYVLDETFVDRTSNWNIDVHATTGNVTFTSRQHQYLRDEHNFPGGLYNNAIISNADPASNIVNNNNIEITRPRLYFDVYSNNNYTVIIMPASYNVTTLEELRTWLQNNPMIFNYKLGTPYTEQLDINPLKSYRNGSIQTSSQQLAPALKTTLPISNKFTTTNLTSGSIYNVYFDGTATQIDAGGTIITNPISPCEVECGGTTLTIEGADIQNVRVIETTVKNEVGSICGTTDVELSRIKTKCELYNYFDDIVISQNIATKTEIDYEVSKMIVTPTSNTVAYNVSQYIVLKGTYKFHCKVKVKSLTDKYKFMFENSNMNTNDVTPTSLVEEINLVSYMNVNTRAYFYALYANNAVEYYDISLIKLSDEDITGTDTSNINYSQVISDLEQPIKLRSLGTTYDSYNPVTGELVKRIGVSETDGSYSVLSNPIVVKSVPKIIKGNVALMDTVACYNSAYKSGDTITLNKGWTNSLAQITGDNTIIKAGVKYLCILHDVVGSMDNVVLSVQHEGSVENINFDNNNRAIFTAITPSTTSRWVYVINTKAHSGTVSFKWSIIEYQDGMENWDIPYFSDYGEKEVQAPLMNNIPQLYTNGQVKVYSDSEVYPTTILNGQSTNNYEINGLETSNNYTIRYEGECESINLANKSNTQGHNAIVKAGATSGNLTFVNDNGYINNVMLVQNDVREQEINHFTGLQTVEISKLRLSTSNVQNIFTQNIFNDFEKIDGAGGSISNNGFLVLNHISTNQSGAFRTKETYTLKPKAKIFIRITQIQYATNSYQLIVQIGGRKIINTSSQGDSNFTTCTLIAEEISKNGYCDLYLTNTSDITYTGQLIIGNYFNQWVISHVAICDEGVEYKELITIDLPQPVQLNSLPNGVCDTYNPITGEYVQNVGIAIMDENGSYGHGWSNSGTAYPVSSCTGFVIGNMASRNNTIASVPNYITNGSYGTAKDYEVKLHGFGNSSKDFRPVIDCGNLLTNGKNNSDGLKAYLKENPIILYYQIVTPIVTQLEPVQIPVFEGGILQLITTDGKVFPMIEYSLHTTNRYDTSTWETGVVYTQRNMTEAYFNESTTPMTPTETMTLTTDHISSGSIILNDNGNGLIVLKGNYTGRDIPYFTGMRSVEAIEVETTPSPDQPLFGKGGRK